MLPGVGCQPQLFVFLIIFEEKIKIFDRFIEHRHDTGQDNCLINFGGVSKLLSGRPLHTIYYGEETSYIRWHLKDFFNWRTFSPQMFRFCFYNDSVSRVKLDLSRKETFSRCKFRFGILAIIVVTEFEWTLLTTTLQLLLRANLWMLLLLMSASLWLSLSMLSQILKIVCQQIETIWFLKLHCAMSEMCWLCRWEQCRDTHKHGQVS